MAHSRFPFLLGAAAVCLAGLAASCTTPRPYPATGPAPVGAVTPPAASSRAATAPAPTPPAAAPTAAVASPAAPATVATPAVSPPAAAAPAAAGGPVPLTVTERLLNEPTRHIIKLSNGVTVLLQQNKTAPVVACRIYVRAGSLTEQQYMGAGLSHVLEHLVAGASSKAVKQADSQQLLKVLGGDSNAYTAYDHTCYFITTTAENWPVAMRLLSDWVTGADFTQEQFDREYKVVQREIEMGEAEADRTFYKMTAANRYLVSPAKYPPIGYKPIFQKLTREDARAYYHQMYVPDNMVVSIAGDIDMDAAEKQVERDFASAVRRDIPVITLPQEPAVTAPRLLIARADVKQARVQWAFPTVDTYSPEMYPLDVLAAILGDGESSVLVHTLRDEKGLVVSIGADDDTPSFAPGSLEFTAILDPANIKPAQDALMQVLHDVLTKGVDASQLEKAKAQTAAALVYGNQTAEQQAERNASDYMTAGNIDFSREYVARIKAVTLDQVNAAARKYIHPDVLLTTVLLPLGAPDTLSPTAIATTGVRSTVERFTLDNGLTVLINRNTAAPIVSFQLYTMGALLAESDGNNGIGNAMMRLMERGTNSHSADEIADYFDSTGGTLATTMGNNTFMVSATCLKDNAAKSFDLFSDVALHPAFSKEELDRLRPRLLAAIQRSTEDWFGEGYKFLRESFYKESPYKRLAAGSADVVAKLTVDDIRKHYDTYFRDPRHSVLAIYGDVDPAQARQWAERFSEMPANNPTLNLTSVPGPARSVTELSKKQSATVFIGYGPGMTVDNKDRFAMTVLQTMLGGYNSPGGSILHETLRGKGLVYVVQASNIAGPARGMFMIMALGEPANAPEIVRIIKEKVADMQAGKFDADAVKTAENQAVTGQQLEDQTIADQAASQALDQLMGLGYDARTKFAENIRAVTKDDVVRVAKEYLQNPVVAITTPDAK